MTNFISILTIIVCFLVFFSPTILGFYTGNHFYNFLYFVSWIPTRVVLFLGEIIEGEFND